MALTGSQVASLISSFISTYGESTGMVRSGTTTTMPVIFEWANRTILETYFDDNTLAGLVFPNLQVFYDSSRTPQVDDTFTRDGVTYAIQQVHYFRLAGTVILVTAVASQPT